MIDLPRNLPRDLAKVFVVDGQPGDYAELDSRGMGTPEGFRYFTSAREALQHNPEEEPNLWIINTDLPDMAGSELFGLLQYRGSRAPVVLVGDEYSVESEINARSSGATLYFTKPLQSEWLSDVVQATS